MAELNSKQQICDFLQNSSNWSASIADVTKVINALAIAPQYPIILVGGTNGKGSTCAFLTTILSHAGYRVGSFTSPHVFDYNERICINNRPISDEELSRTLAKVINQSPVNLGLFKTFALASHLLFARHKIDIAIVEVGIGGRQDVTNLFEPTIAAITTVALDHCALLGDNREAIAIEKAHIYRPGKPALFGEKDIPQSLSQYATSIASPLSCFGHEFGFRRHEFSWDFYCAEVKHYSLPFPSLRGSEQLKNASLALAILAKLRLSFPLNLAQIKQGLLQTVLVGRFQVLAGVPQIILDTAHNPQAIESMLENMLKLQFTKRSFALFAVAADKNWRAIIKQCLPHFKHWLLAPLDSPRSCSAEEIKDFLITSGVKPEFINCYQNIASALRGGYQQLTSDDRLVCFGSFLVVEAAYLAVQKVR